MRNEEQMSSIRKNIGLFRVSKEEEHLQDIDVQINKVLEKFAINKNDITIYQERGSAYDIDKFVRRQQFIKLLSDVFNAHETTVLDVFLGNIPVVSINLYIWDYSRIMRNLEYSLFFSMLCTFADVRIYSYNDEPFAVNMNMSPTEKLVKYLDLSIKAYSGEEYSYNISKNVKKMVDSTGGTTYSTKGNKWGRKFTDVYGKKIDLDRDIEQQLLKYVEKRLKLYIKIKKIGYYDLIIKECADKFLLKISKSYISKIKNRMTGGE